MEWIIQRHRFRFGMQEQTHNESAPAIFEVRSRGPSSAYLLKEPLRSLTCKPTQAKRYVVKVVI
jgi:hypothetical protein